MKFRIDYVTNSSSSSFICDICGRVESGWDLGLDEADMMECINGHTICRYEMLEMPPKEELVKMILENEWNKKWNWRSQEYMHTSEEILMDTSEENLIYGYCSDGGYGIPEFLCPICQFIEYSESDLSAYLLKEYGIPRDEVFAEVKKFNKRRKKLYESEYITHVCQKFNLNPTEIVASWKEKFGSYSKFKEYLNN